MSRFSLKGRTALVTGGARGCGLAFAQSCAESGADVAIFDVIQPDDTFRALRELYGVRVEYYEVDVSSEQSLQNGFNQFKSDFSNALDICIPCAGINRHLPFLEFSYQDHRDLLSVNVLGSYFTAQLAARQMIANGTRHGSIIMVASIAGERAIRSQLCSAYCGSKGAVKAMCPAIAQELAPHVSFVLPLYCITTDEQGIRINSISPGYVQTEMTAGVSTLRDVRDNPDSSQFPQLLESWKSEIMLGRVAQPDDLRGACMFLASDASAYMTGQDIVVDGGVTRW